MKLQVTYPTSLSEIPLQNYQKWLKVKEKTTDEELLAHKFIQIFLGLELNEAVQIQAKDMKKMVSLIAEALQEKPKFKQRFKIKDREFGFIPNLENISWGEYIDIENNLTSWENFHIALAVLYRPITNKVGDTYEIMEYKGDEEFHDLMKLVPLDIAMSASVFFWSLEKALLKDTLQYLQEQVMKTKAEIPMNIQRNINLINNGGGITAYIDYLKGTLDSLTMLHNYPCIDALPFSAMKYKRTG